MDHFQLSMIIAILFGIALSVAIPYFRKLAEGKITSFDYKYLYTAIGTAIWQELLMARALIDWEAPEGVTLFLALIMAVTFGYGGIPLQEQAYKYIKKEKV